MDIDETAFEKGSTEADSQVKYEGMKPKKTFYNHLCLAVVRPSVLTEASDDFGVLFMFNCYV